MPAPKATKFFATTGFTCSECNRQFPRESGVGAKPPTFNEWPPLQGHRICDDCLPAAIRAHPGVPSPSAASAPMAAGPAAARGKEQVSVEPDRARVVRRSAFGRVEVELSSAGRPGEAPEALLERVRGVVRAQYEDELLEALKEEEASRAR
jgi:hypothetical protein